MVRKTCCKNNRIRCTVSFDAYCTSSSFHFSSKWAYMHPEVNHIENAIFGKRKIFLKIFHRKRYSNRSSKWAYRHAEANSIENANFRPDVDLLKIFQREKVIHQKQILIKEKHVPTVSNQQWCGIFPLKCKNVKKNQFIYNIYIVYLCVYMHVCIHSDVFIL